MSDESDHISDDSLDDGSTSEESYSDSSDSEQGKYDFFGSILFMWL